MHGSKINEFAHGESDLIVGFEPYLKFPAQNQRNISLENERKWAICLVKSGREIK